MKLYIKSRIKITLMFGGILGIFWLIFYLHNSSLEAVKYASQLSLSFLLICGCIDFGSYYKKVTSLAAKASGITFELGELPEVRDGIEFQYQKMLTELYQYKEEVESKSSISYQDMQDYYSMWVHQIKTPISAMRLVLQSEEQNSDLTKVLKMELFKIEQYVDMVLSYLRMKKISSDMVLQWYTATDIAKQAIRKYSQLFILKQIKLEFKESEEKVLTDEKWVLFVLEQILSNALKYTKEGTIFIHMDEEREGTLVIKDTGIGIQPEDLPRVFEKGFTGYNGRKEKKSTGIGLYLCKYILDKLNHQISIVSGEGAGTTVYINLHRNSQVSE